MIDKTANVQSRYKNIITKNTIVVAENMTVIITIINEEKKGFWAR